MAARKFFGEFTISYAYTYLHANYFERISFSFIVIIFIPKIFIFVLNA